MFDLVDGDFRLGLKLNLVGNVSFKQSQNIRNNGYNEVSMIEIFSSVNMAILGESL